MENTCQNCFFGEDSEVMFLADLGKYPLVCVNLDNNNSEINRLKILVSQNSYCAFFKPNNNFIEELTLREQAFADQEKSDLEHHRQLQKDGNYGK